MSLFIHLLARGTLSSPCLKKVNALTFKLKTHLGKVGGQTSVVGEEERRRKRRRRGQLS